MNVPELPHYLSIWLSLLSLRIDKAEIEDALIPPRGDWYAEILITLLTGR